MKKHIYMCAAVLMCLALFAICLAACEIDSTTTLKDITKPYITRYECTYAALGGEDLLQDYEYIRITLTDEKEGEISFNQKGERARAVTFAYTYDKESGSFSAQSGALGVEMKERTVIKDGAFTIDFPLGGKELVLKFEKM